MDAERNEQIVDLQSLGAGAVNEKFAAELKAVLENIRDPNTEAEAARKIVLEFIFLPAPDREKVMTSITARSVFARTKPTSDLVFIGRQDGETVATVIHGAHGPEDPRQGILPIERKEASNER